MQGWSLEKLVGLTRSQLYNNASQVWLHNFFWAGLTDVAQEPGPETMKLIEASYASVASFKSCFIGICLTQFGSGYYCLGFHRHYPLSLRCMVLPDSTVPMHRNIFPLLIIDLWEHAYYIDYKKNRKAYLESIWLKINWNQIEKKLVNWKKIAETYYWM